MTDSHSGGAVRFLALGGMAAPVLMLTLWTVASLLRPGYNQINQYGSELGTGPNAFIMNANFVVTGLLIVAFATGLFKNINGGRWILIGSILLGLFGVGEAVGGFFPCDPGCPVAAQSLSQLTHNADAVIAFLAIPLAPFSVSLGLNRDDRWQGYSSYSLATGITAVGLFLVFSAGALGSLGYVDSFNDYSSQCHFSGSKSLLYDSSEFQAIILLFGLEPWNLRKPRLSTVPDANLPTRVACLGLVQLRYSLIKSWNEGSGFVLATPIEEA